MHHKKRKTKFVYLHYKISMYSVHLNKYDNSFSFCLIVVHAPSSFFFLIITFLENTFLFLLVFTANSKCLLALRHVKLVTVDWRIRIYVHSIFIYCMQLYVNYYINKDSKNKENEIFFNTVDDFISL